MDSTAVTPRATKRGTDVALPMYRRKGWTLEFTIAADDRRTLCGSASGAGDEIRRQPGPDVVGDDLGGAVLGVALAARAGEALRWPGMS